MKGYFYAQKIHDCVKLQLIKIGIWHSPNTQICDLYCFVKVIAVLYMLMT